MVTSSSNTQQMVMDDEKRKHTQPTHRLSFGERFDEKMLSVYRNGFQCIKSPIHQFIGFSPFIKSAVGTIHHPYLYAVVPTGNHAGTAVRNAI